MSTTKCVLTVLPFGLKIGNRYTEKGASVVAQMIKNQLAMQETSVQSLGWEDSPGELHGLYSPWSRKELDTTEQLSLTHIHSKYLI